MKIYLRFRDQRAASQYNDAYRSLRRRITTVALAAASASIILVSGVIAERVWAIWIGSIQLFVVHLICWYGFHKIVEPLHLVYFDEVFMRKQTEEALLIALADNKALREAIDEEIRNEV